MRTYKTPLSFLVRRVALLFASSALILTGIGGQAQTANMSELRELRIACLETFSSAQARLSDLNSFVDQQAARQRAAADKLFELRHDSATAKRRSAQMKETHRQNGLQLEQIQIAVEQATTSYRAATKALPTGEKWAAEGSAALNELRRAVAAAPQQEWKRSRLNEVEGEFTSALRCWRDDRRAFEKADFDLELRASPSVFKRITDQLTSANDELKVLDTRIGERDSELAAQEKDNERWEKTIRLLREGNANARSQLSSNLFQFHLVDLKFTAWRLNASGDLDREQDALPDALEIVTPLESVNSMLGEPAKIPGATRMPEATPTDSVANAALEGAHTVVTQQPDPAFSAILSRINLATGRLRYLSETLEAENARVRSAVEQLETAEQKSLSIIDDTARLAEDLETLRRSIQTEHSILSAGLETQELVQKRFDSDLATVKRLLEESAERTTRLAKSLEK